MKVAKDGIRSIVHIGYDGRVHKKFRGTDNDKRFANEVRVLRALEARGCDFVPQLLDFDEEELSIVTTNCGAPAPSVSEAKAKELFESLETQFGIVHDDPFPRNITYNDKMGRFCVIDFELAEIKEDPSGTIESCESEATHRELEWCGLTRSGSRKKSNQDSLSVFASEDGWARNEELDGSRSIDEDGLIFAVSDGMGGTRGGAIASGMVVRELRRFLPAMMGDFARTTVQHSLLESAIQSLHDFVSRTASRRPGYERMGATVVCGLFYRTHLHFAHVGDSRLYRFRNEELTQLTFDHTYVGEQFRSGKINERECRLHPRRNVLSQCIGGRCQFVRPQVGSDQLKKGDWLLICSDGVIDGLWNKNIAEAFSTAVEKDQSAKEVGERILNWAYDVAGKDDTTLFVVKVK